MMISNNILLMLATFSCPSFAVPEQPTNGAIPIPIAITTAEPDAEVGAEHRAPTPAPIADTLALMEHPSLAPRLPPTPTERIQAQQGTPAMILTSTGDDGGATLTITITSNRTMTVRPTVTVASLFSPLSPTTTMSTNGAHRLSPPFPLILWCWVDTSSLFVIFSLATS
ncbi:hypothetical protein HD806DRAFT_733 [Xylariaceae sp. AK1471]|nr:hypothetical protein HD806DRAFT_733 [Xylariaceae sp. AK1471]